MIIKIIDYKKRKTLNNELQDSISEIANFILKENLLKIKKIKVVVLKSHPTANGYDLAFKNLLEKKNGIVNLIITPSYDKNFRTRRSLIAHELTHVNQMLKGEIVFNLKDNKKEYLYLGEVYSKVYSFDKFDSIPSRKKQIEYISKICPWEKEPSILADRAYSGKLK